MTRDHAAEYGIRYGDKIVRDPSWRCIADVIATYHGTDWTTPDGRVTGVLIHRTLPDGEWEVAA